MSVKPICPHYSFESPGTIFDEEAMTALELAARTARKVNECVEEVNHIPAKVAQDVNTHIVAGDFDRQIDKYSNEFGTNVTRRIDNILASGEQPSEVVDMRYQFDGKTAGSAGTAMREQFKVLHRLENGAIFAGNNNPLKISKNTDGSITVKFTSKLTIMVNGKEAVVSWDDLLANIPDHSTKDGDIVTITIPTYQALIYKDGDYALSIKGVKNLDALEIPLIINGWCEVLGGNLAVEWGLHNIHKQMANQAQTVYHAWPPRFELTPRYTHTDGKVYLRIRVSDLFTCMTADPTNRTRALEFTPERVSELGACYFVDASGMHTILLEPYHILVYNVRTDHYAIRQYMDYIDPDDIVMMTTAWGTPLAGTLMDNYNAYHTYSTANTNGDTGGVYKEYGDKVANYSAVCANASYNSERILFFTDPHLCQKGEDWEALFTQYMGTVREVFNVSPADRVICGGDWLGNGDTKKEALYKLGFVRGKMREMFGDKIHMVVGNHDTNYQGADPATDVLTQKEVANVLLGNPNADKCYYDFMTANTHFFVFNCGVDNNDTEREFCDQQAQITWFKNKLLERANATAPYNIVLIFHMVNTTSDSNVLNGVTNYALQIAKAFNNRTSFYHPMLGGTVDFSNIYIDKGYVQFGLSGHYHEERAESINDFPVFTFTHLRDGDTPSFALLGVNYDNREMHIENIGEGTFSVKKF